MAEQRESSAKGDFGRTERLKYLTAMSVALGVDEESAKKIADTFLKETKKFEKIDFHKERNELNPVEIARIESIGRRFLIGSPQQDQLKFTVGSRVLSLLKEDPKSGYFEHLGEYIDYWTDGTGGNKFREMVGKQAKK